MASQQSLIQAGAVLRGALLGVVAIAAISALRAVLDRSVDGFDESGWVPLFAIALFAAYGLAGAATARRTPLAPLSNGMIAGITAFVIWVPIRFLIWVVREDARGLVDGPNPVFTAGQLFGQLLFAAAFGLLGAWIADRRQRARSSP